MPDGVTMLTTNPDFRPYSALNVALSILISCAVEIDVSSGTPLNCSLIVTPLTRKLTVSSRFPAVLNA